MILNDMTAPTFKYKPSTAFKVLTYILYGQYPHMIVSPWGVIELQSIRKLARTLGTESSRINRHLLWLESQGYLEGLQYAQDRRSCKFRVRVPSNIIYA